MSIEDQVSSEQWKSLFNTTSAASAYVASASGGGLEMFKELFSASKFMLDSIKNSNGSGYGELADAFLEKMKGMSYKDVKENAAKYESRDLNGMRAEAKQVVADGVAVAATLPGSDGFKRWILDMAREVAETKTGGVLGIGGSSVVDEKEQAALDELAAMMGV